MMPITLTINDYFEGGELNSLLAEYGYEIVERTYTAVSTLLVVDAIDLDAPHPEDLAAILSDALYATVRVL
jgi:hypothetical protein